MALPLPELLQLLRHPNVVGFERVLRQGESSQGDDAWHLLVYGGRFESLADHPRKHFDRITLRYVADWRNAPPNSTTSAAGAFQITETSWDRFCKDTGYSGAFDETGQRLYMVWAIAGRGALDDLLAGDLYTVIKKCRPEWTSLPGAAESHGTWTFEKARQVYVKYGGTFAPVDQVAAEQPPAPVEDRIVPPDNDSTSGKENGMEQDSILGTIGSIAGAAAPVASAINPIAGLVLGLANSLIAGFQPLIKEKVAKEINRHTDDPAIGGAVADSLIKKAQELTAKPDPIEAVAAARSNVDIMAQLEQHALDELERLAPFLDKIHQYSRDEWAATQASMDAAAARAKGDANDQDVFLTRSIVYMLAALLTGVGVLIGVLSYFKLENGVMGLIGLFTTVAGMVVGKFGTRYDHRYGSSNTSSAKDATIQQLARVK